MVLTLYCRKIRQIIPNTNLILGHHLSEDNKISKKPKEIAHEIVNQSLPENENSSKLSQKSNEVAQGIIKEFPEEPTTCCMSGCGNCVWLEYAEKISAYFNDGGEKAEQEIMKKVQDPNIKSFLLQELRMKKL